MIEQTTNPLTTETIIRILKASQSEYTELVHWIEDSEGNLQFLVLCGDFFYWGTADLEEITENNVDVLLESIDDCERIVGKQNADDAFLLFCSRSRNMRPQGAYYSILDKELWHLFDAAGPERELDIFNPKERPSDD